MSDTKPGYDTLKNMLLTAEERAQLAEQRADKAEGKLEKAGRFIFGSLLLLMEPDEIIARVMKSAERNAKRIE